MRLFRLLFMVRLAFGCFPSINKLGPNVQSTTSATTTSCPVCSTTIMNMNAANPPGTVQVTGAFCQGTSGMITCPGGGNFHMFGSTGNVITACTAAKPCFAMCTSAGVFGMGGSAGVSTKLLVSVDCGAAG